MNLKIQKSENFVECHIFFFCTYNDNGCTTEIHHLSLGKYAGDGFPHIFWPSESAHTVIHNQKSYPEIHPFQRDNSELSSMNSIGCKTWKKSSETTKMSYIQTFLQAVLG